jgi:DNA-binding transcriptional regulator PaaX
MKLRDDVLAAEAAASLVVLTELDQTPMYPIEIKPREGQSETEIREAVERCEATGWIRTGPAQDRDPRSHLTEAGRAELAVRRIRRRVIVHRERR